MPSEEVTYYAIVGRGKAADDPHGIVRRRRPTDGGVADEALHRDLEWHRTGIIVEWEHSSFADELEEVDEEKAMQIIENFRAGGPYSPLASFTLDDAIALARMAHSGQTDKAGRPYIEHPLRVMRRVHSEHEKMTAVLHDVLEDTPSTVDDLRSAGCPKAVIAAVQALTKRPGESLADSMARAAADPIAAVVKRADIADNSDPARLALLDPATADRLRTKYADSIRLLDELRQT